MTGTALFGGQSCQANEGRLSLKFVLLQSLSLLKVVYNQNIVNHQLLSFMKDVLLYLWLSLSKVQRLSSVEKFLFFKVVPDCLF